MQTLSTPHEPASAVANTVVHEFAAEPQSLDRKLAEIRSGRRLIKVVSSIENFLQSQISRIDKVLEECRLAENNDQILQQRLQDFEREKLEWEATRNSENLRLTEASEKLIQGWKQLEDERRVWLDERGSHLIPTSR